MILLNTPSIFLKVGITSITNNRIANVIKKILLKKFIEYVLNSISWVKKEINRVSKKKKNAPKINSPMGIKIFLIILSSPSKLFYHKNRSQ